MKLFTYGTLFGIDLTIVTCLARNWITQKSKAELQKIEDKLNPHA